MRWRPFIFAVGHVVAALILLRTHTVSTVGLGVILAGEVAVMVWDWNRSKLEKSLTQLEKSLTQGVKDVGSLAAAAKAVTPNLKTAGNDLARDVAGAQKVLQSAGSVVPALTSQLQALQREIIERSAERDELITACEVLRDELQYCEFEDNSYEDHRDDTGSDEVQAAQALSRYIERKYRRRLSRHLEETVVGPLLRSPSDELTDVLQEIANQLLRLQPAGQLESIADHEWCCCTADAADMLDCLAKAPGVWAASTVETCLAGEGYDPLSSAVLGGIVNLVVKTAIAPMTRSLQIAATLIRLSVLTTCPEIEHCPAKDSLMRGLVDYAIEKQVERLHEVADKHHALEQQRQLPLTWTLPGCSQSL